MNKEDDNNRKNRIGEFVKMCECGKPLVAIIGKDGNRLGVTHIEDGDEEHHYGFFGSLFDADHKNN